MKPVYIEAIGLVAPGLSGWRASQARLNGNQPYLSDPLPALKPEMLKPNERRRTSNTIKLALLAINDALGDRALDNHFATIFSSSEGDLEIADKICRALDSTERPVSPTHFHNSVHNAPAGYASIASGSQSASSSLAGANGSFAMGLLESSLQAQHEEQAILYVAYDYATPYPLSEPIPITHPFAVALLLSTDQQADGDIARIALQVVGAEEENRSTDPQFEQLRQANPAARSLPLLQAAASLSTGRLTLPYLPKSNLAVEISPC